jgi:hypothetical protein
MSAHDTNGMHPVDQRLLQKRPLVTGLRETVGDVVGAECGLHLDAPEHALDREQELCRLREHRGLVGLLVDDDVRLAAVLVGSVDQQPGADAVALRDERLEDAGDRGRHARTRLSCSRRSLGPSKPTHAYQSTLI